MALKNIQLCHLDPVSREKGTWNVTIHNEDQAQNAVFRCSSEAAAIALRDAIRQHADKLLRASNYTR